MEQQWSRERLRAWSNTCVSGTRDVQVTARSLRTWQGRAHGRPYFPSMKIVLKTTIADVRWGNNNKDKIPLKLILWWSYFYIQTNSDSRYYFSRKKIRLLTRVHETWINDNFEVNYGMHFLRLSRKIVCESTQHRAARTSIPRTANFLIFLATHGCYRLIAGVAQRQLVKSR